MEKKNHIVQGNGQPEPSAPRRKSDGYTGAVCEGCAETRPESEGETDGSVVGCNANNGRASARTSNCNNHAGNGNDNYAGAFAVVSEKKEGLASCAASTNTTEGPAATGAQGRRDYGELPFWGDANAESDASATEKEMAVRAAIEAANRRRKLRNMRPILTDRTLMEMAFDQTLKRSSSARRIKDYYARNKKSVCDALERELRERTYRQQPMHRTMVVKRGKGDKNRNADVSPMRDRVVQTMLLMAMAPKLQNVAAPQTYSGIRGRSILSGDRRWCMANRIRQYVATHPDAWAGLTDVRKFYESLDMSVVLGALFKIVVCPYARWLLAAAFAETRTLPLGCCLSQLLSAVVMAEVDRDVVARYGVRMFCFGDNRLLLGDRRSVREAMGYQMSYYEGRYGLTVKGDYQMRRVKDGFSFCRYKYKETFVSLRAEIRRRAIRAWGKGKHHYAGYKGMLMKTDSKRLRHLIETDSMELRNRHGMTVTTQRGDKVKLRDLSDGAEVVVAEYSIEPSEAKARDGKRGEMVRMTYVHIKEDGRRRLCHSTEGSEEIVGFFHLVAEGKAELHQRLHVGKEGNRIFFEEYHTTKEEACDIICKMLGI